MSIFQKSVLNKYLKNLDNDKVNLAYDKFQKFYGDKLRLHNIMQLKEENYQEGFLREIFVQVLGYTINPDKDYNLTTEFKNQKDSRKADGAIVTRGHAPLAEPVAIGVIELKSTKTKDLESIKEQAFGYKVNQPNCKYVITSNFQSIRFYIDNATEYEEFNLFDLSKEQFRVFYLLLNNESILNHLPEKLKQETKFHDEQITQKLYKDYKAFKDRIFEFLCSGNPQYDKLTLFKKSQKLLDRFLFILFAEDGGLIPPNAISKIIEQWKQLQELEKYDSLYSRFQLFFTHLDKGHLYKQWGEIPAYNGGLFRYDEILDNPDLKLPDGLLQNHTSLLSAYDFGSEVDVNILGHIFEHSLSEIEEMEQNLQGFENLEGLPKVSKRKKDGIFYTPKYITKYIVENTVGALCTERKIELQIKGLLIDDTYYVQTRRGASLRKLNPKGKDLFETLQTYKKWLLTLKILDPACGSGAFLNATLDFLIAEHNEIDNIISELTGDKMRMFDTDKQILENNIYGVDINEESVEIAKLSLWLRTAQRGRALSDLSDNIKCGNSLIDDPKVAGSKAFDWNTEFKDIMDKGGFDVVLGNPPYGAFIAKNQEKYLIDNYRTCEYQVNTYVLFYEKGINLLREQGMLSYISPANFIYQHYFKKLRAFFERYSIYSIRKYEYEIFPDANIGDGIVWTMQKAVNQRKNIFASIVENEANADSPNNIELNYSEVVNTDGTYALNGFAINMIKIRNNCVPLGKISMIIMGIKPYQVGKGKPKQDFEIVKNKPFTSDIQKDNTFQEYLIGKDFNRYTFVPHPKKYLKYGIWLAEPRETAPFFDTEKMIIRQTADKIIANLDLTKSLNLNNIYNIGKIDNKFSLKYLLSILNSKLFVYIYRKVAQEKGRIFPEVKKVYLDKLPIKKVVLKCQQPFIEKTDLMLSLNKKLQTEKSNFINSLKEDKGVEKITRVIEGFNELEYDALKKELLKQKVKISLGNENNEWREYFNTTKQKVNDLQNKINQTDKEIDRMVYELYELTAEEIEIVENSVK